MRTKYVCKKIERIYFNGFYLILEKQKPFIKSFEEVSYNLDDLRYQSKVKNFSDIDSSSKTKKQVYLFIYLFFSINKLYYCIFLSYNFLTQ